MAALLVQRERSSELETSIFMTPPVWVNFEAEHVSGKLLAGLEVMGISGYSVALHACHLRSSLICQLSESSRASGGM
jgi:hypothetical protein